LLQTTNEFINEEDEQNRLLFDKTHKITLLEKYSSSVSEASPVFLKIKGFNAEIAHALLAYGHETGVYTPHGTDKIYHNRFVVYDCNYSTEKCFLYYDRTLNKVWYFGEEKRLCVITDNVSVLDPIGYTEHLNSKVFEYIQEELNSNYITVRRKDESDKLNFDVSINGDGYHLSPQSDLNEKGIVPILFCGDPYDEEGNPIPAPEISYLMPEDTHDYTIYPTEDQSCDFSLMSNEAFTYIEADAAKEIRIKDDGFIEASGVEGEYILSVTVDDITESYPWHTTQACGTADGTVSMELTEEGVVIAGTDLSGVTVTVERDDVTDEIRFTASEDSVLIVPKKEGDMEEVKIIADTDGDGEYETELAAEPDVLPGDVNADNTVDRKDLLILSRYLAGWTGYEEKLVSKTAANLNGDDTIDARDRMILARHLNGVSGYEQISRQ